MIEAELGLLLNTILLPVVVRVLLEFSPLARAKYAALPAIALLLWIDLTAVLWLDCSIDGIACFVAALGLTVLALPSSLREYTEILGRWRFPLYLASMATLAFVVYLHLPITTFLTSPGELDIHLDQLVSENARDAVVVVYVAAAVYALAVPPRLRTALALISIWSVGVGLVYSYVLPFGYPLMSGLTFEQIPVSAGLAAARAALDAVVVIALTVLLPLLVRRAGPRAIGIALALVNLSLIGASGVSVYSGPSAATAQDGENGGSEARPLVLSQSGPNVLVIFLDRFMGGFIESLVQQDPTLMSRLSGFTWYPRTVSPGENTIVGAHSVFGGYDYVPRAMNARGRELKQTSAEAYNLLPQNFSREGYEVHFVNPRGLGFTMEGDCSYLRGPGIHCNHVPASIMRERATEMGVPLVTLSKANYGNLLVLLGSMRAAPYSLKAVLNQRGPWKPFMDHTAGTTFRQWAELEALPRLTTTTASGKHLSIFWSILPHEPYYLNEECRPIENRYTVDLAEVRGRGHASLYALQHAIAAKCTLQLVAAYFDWMKQAGVYDQTRIVVVSDHGIVGPVEDTSSRAVAGSTTENVYVRSRSLLLVKPRGSTGPLQVSEEFLPNAEVPRIACEEIGGCTNPYLNDRPIASRGDEPFVVSSVPWQYNKQKSDAFVILRELQLTGSDPYDAQSWTDLKSRE